MFAQGVDADAYAHLRRRSSGDCVAATVLTSSSPLAVQRKRSFEAAAGSVDPTELLQESSDSKHGAQAAISNADGTMSPSFNRKPSLIPKTVVLDSEGQPKRRGSVDMLRLDLEQTEEVQTNKVKHCVLHPFSEVRYFWDQALLLFMAYSSVILPLQFADLTGADDFAESNLPVVALDQLTNLIFVIDLLLNFRTGYLDKQRRAVVLDPTAMSRNYLRSWFLPDLLATIPWDLVDYGCGAACESDDTSKWVLKWLRLLRLCRLLRLTRILGRLQVRLGLKQTMSMALFFGLGGLFMAHLSACLWYAIGNNVGTWVDRYDPNQEWALADGYVTALYWSFTTMSTIGYGDIHAGNTVERLFSCVIMVLGSCVYAYGITSVISSMSGVNEQQRRLYNQKDQLNRYISTMSVPKDLRQKLREYFVHYQNSSDTFNEANVLAMLSPGLRSRLSSLANAPLLRKVTFFKEVDEACVTEMAQLLVPNLFVPDEVIITRGYIGEEMYVIKNGEVLVYIDFGESVQELANLASGQFFGEGALLKGKSARRGANVAAVTYSLIYSLHVDEMNRMLVRYPKVRETIEKIAKEREDATATLSVRHFGAGENRAAAMMEAQAEALKAAKKSSQKNEKAKELAEWLTSLGLDSYIEVFRKHGYESLLSVEAMSSTDLETHVKDARMLPGHAAVFRQAHGRLKQLAAVGGLSALPMPPNSESLNA